MRNKDEYSMTKQGLTFSKSQPNILNLGMTNSNGRNKISNKLVYKKREIEIKSLPKLIKGSKIHNDRMNNRSIYNNNSNYSSLINYCDKKKHLSFYKGANISVSSFFLDTNKTLSTDMRSSIGFTNINFSNNKFQKFKHKIIEENNIIDIFNLKNGKKLDFREKSDKIKSTLNPSLDISKLTYKTTITSIRNKYSILFNKEFDLFDKFIPSLYTLKFNYETKFYLNQLHNKILSCTKDLAGVFLDQDIEKLKMTEQILEKVLNNILEVFIYNNKVTNSLIKHTKKIMVDTNRDQQAKKEIVEADTDDKIKKLKKKLENRNEKLKQIKTEKFQEYNNYLISMKKLRDEQKDLVKLLNKNKNYFNMYQNCQQEIKEKNNIIIQKNIDYKDMLDKNFFDKVKLEENINDLNEYIILLQEENENIKNQLKDLEEQLSFTKNIMGKKNSIIYSLQENLMMKEEELMCYLNENDKIKEKNDKLSCDLINMTNKYQNLNMKIYNFTSFNYENKIDEG